MTTTKTRVAPGALPAPAERYSRENEAQFRAMVSRMMATSVESEDKDGFILRHAVNGTDETKVTVEYRWYDLDYIYLRYRKWEFDFSPEADPFAAPDWVPSNTTWSDAGTVVTDEDNVECYVFSLEIARGSVAARQGWPVIFEVQWRKEGDLLNKDRWVTKTFTVFPQEREIEISEAEVDATWQPRRVGALYLQVEPLV